MQTYKNDGKEYIIDTRSLREGILYLIGLSDGEARQLRYDNRPEIEEIKEVTTKGEMYLDLGPGENAGDPPVTVEKYHDDVITYEPTGKMIPNPNYEPLTSLSEIEDRLVSQHGFTT